MKEETEISNFAEGSAKNVQYVNADDDAGILYETVEVKLPSSLVKKMKAVTSGDYAVDGSYDDVVRYALRRLFIDSPIYVDSINKNAADERDDAVALKWDLIRKLDELLKPEIGYTIPGFKDRNDITDFVLRSVVDRSKIDAENKIAEHKISMFIDSCIDSEPKDKPPFGKVRLSEMEDWIVGSIEYRAKDFARILLCDLLKNIGCSLAYSEDEAIIDQKATHKFNIELELPNREDIDEWCY